MILYNVKMRCFDFFMPMQTSIKNLTHRKKKTFLYEKKIRRICAKIFMRKRKGQHEVIWEIHQLCDGQSSMCRTSIGPEHALDWCNNRMVECRCNFFIFIFRWNVKLKSVQAQTEMVCEWVLTAHKLEWRCGVVYSFDKFRGITCLGEVNARKKWIEREREKRNYTFRSGISFLWNRTSSVSLWFDSVEIVIGSVYLFRLVFVSMITAHFCGFLAIKRNALQRLTHNTAIDMYHTYSVTLFIFNWKSILFDTVCALLRSPLTISIRITYSLIWSRMCIVYRPLIFFISSLLYERI